MKKLQSILLIAIISISLGIGTNAATKSTKVITAPKVNVQAPIVADLPDSSYQPTSSLDIVANPAKYLNKKVKIKAKFDKFSTLGLDYKPAFRNSEKYITFLIKRDDVTNHTVPLSEMKNFLERSVAEKYIDLKSGDDIEYCGVVFSNALGDAWVSVDRFSVLNAKPKEAESTKK
jgi:hypothetical protein